MLLHLPGCGRGGLYVSGDGDLQLFGHPDRHEGGDGADDASAPGWKKDEAPPVHVLNVDRQCGAGKGANIRGSAYHSEHGAETVLRKPEIQEWLFNYEAFCFE